MEKLVSTPCENCGKVDREDFDGYCKECFLKKIEKEDD